jgi:hypothetical protein
MKHIIVTVLMLLSCTSQAGLSKDEIYDCVSMDHETKVERVHIYHYEKGGRDLYEMKLVSIRGDVEETKNIKVTLYTQHDGNLVRFGRGASWIKIFLWRAREQKYQAHAKFTEYAVSSKNWTCKKLID